MSDVGASMERHQVPLYLAAIIVGVAIGVTLPHVGSTLTSSITPALAALLYVTFLQVPFRRLWVAARDLRFLGALVVLNFLAVPLVVAAMTVVMPASPAVRLGIALVLLCPCVDYVIVFAGLAGGDGHRLLAATPLLLVAQMALTPVFLTLLMGAEVADVIEVRPFLHAFVWLIVVPLALAWSTQAIATTTTGQRFTSAATTAMVPLMMVVLGCVVASQIPQVGGDFGAVAGALPFFVVFLIVMPMIGVVVGRGFGLDVPARRAAIFSGATRNSLVVLPLALALPAGYGVAAIVVVAQTLIEILGMVVYVRVIPMIVRAPADDL